MALTDPVLLAQWDRERNGDLTPNDVTHGSHRRVWWRCEKGHIWQAEVKSRTLLGAGCPVCAGKAVVPGRMIWRPSDRIWPLNGTSQKTSVFPQGMCGRGAAGKSGGSVPAGTNGRLR